MDNREQWLERRRTSIGASDAAILIMGELYGRTQVDVLKDKLGLSTNSWADNSPDIRAGNLYEPLAVEAYRHSTGNAVNHKPDDPERLTYRTGLYIHASLDAVEILPNNTLRVIEVKAPREGRARDTEVDGPLQSWVVQVQFQLAVIRAAGIPGVIGARVVVWHREEARIHWHDVPDSPEDQARAAGWLDMAADWYERHVCCGEPLAEMQPIELWKSDTEVDLTGSVQGTIVSEYAKACDALKAAEEIKREAALALADVAEAHRARKIIADGYRLTRIVNKGRKSLDMERAKAENPGIPWDSYEKQGGEYVAWRVSEVKP